MLPLWQVPTSRSSRLWYVIFTPLVGNISWPKRLSMAGHPEDIKHVQLASPVTDYHMLSFDPRQTHLHLDLLELDKPFTLEMQALSKKHKIVAYWAEPETSVTAYNLVPSCVSAVKAAMGIKCKAQTPYGLYKHLLSDGGSLVRQDEF